MYYGCHKVNFRRGGSYIDSPDWIKKKKSNNKSERCRQYFQYVVTVVLNYGENESHPERVSNTRPFINKYKWKGINYASKIDDWKTLRKIIQQLLLIFCILKKKKYLQFLFQKLIRILKNNFLMIPNEEKEGQHYLAAKNPSSLLRGVTSKHHGDFSCLYCLNPFKTENKLNSHEKVCKNNDFCGIVRPSEKDKIRSHQKSDKMLYMLTWNL